MEVSVKTSNIPLFFSIDCLINNPQVAQSTLYIVLLTMIHFIVVLRSYEFNLLFDFRIYWILYSCLCIKIICIYVRMVKTKVFIFLFYRRMIWDVALHSIEGQHYSHPDSWLVYVIVTVACFKFKFKFYYFFKWKFFWYTQNHLNINYFLLRECFCYSVFSRADLWMVESIFENDFFRVYEYHSK